MNTSPAWLADITIDGVILRVASREIDATIDGETQHYDAGLVAPRINLHDTTDREDLRLMVDNFALGFDEIAQGSLLIGTKALLRWHNPQGRTIVVFQGDSVQASLAKVGRVELQLRRTLTLPLVPPARLSISALTHPINPSHTLKIPQEEGAEPYPLTVGVTQITGQSFWSGVYFAPVASYDESGADPGTGSMEVVLNGGPIGATTVDIVVEGQLEEGGKFLFPAESVVLINDKLGQPISIVQDLGQLIGPDFFKNADAPEVFFSFTDGQGGILSTVSPGVAQGVGDVILTLLDTYQPEQTVINRDDFYLRRAKFNQYNVSFQVINQMPLNKIIDDILKLTPFLSVPTDRGKSYRYIDFQATRADATYHITDGVDGVSRLGGITYAKQTVINALHISYGRKLGAGGESLQAPNVTEVYYSVDPNDAEGHPIASTPRSPPAGSGPVGLSRAVYGRREATLDIPITFDINTIDQVARDTLKQRAFPLRRLSYRIPEGNDRITPADIITVTDDKLSIVQEPFIVSDVTLDPTGNVLSLLSVNGRPTPQLAVG